MGRHSSYFFHSTFEPIVLVCIWMYEPNSRHWKPYPISCSLLNERAYLCLDLDGARSRIVAHICVLGKLDIQPVLQRAQHVRVRCIPLERLLPGTKDLPSVQQIMIERRVELPRRYRMAIGPSIHRRIRYHGRVSLLSTLPLGFLPLGFLPLSELPLNTLPLRYPARERIVLVKLCPNWSGSIAPALPLHRWCCIQFAARRSFLSIRLLALEGAIRSWGRCGACNSKCI